jgi:hypothetical protein
VKDGHFCRGKKVCRECDYGVVIVSIGCKVGSLGEAVGSVSDAGFVHECNRVFFSFCNVAGDAGADLVGVSVVLQVCMISNDNSFVVLRSLE